MPRYILEIATEKEIGIKTIESSGFHRIRGVVTEKVAVVWPDGNEWSLSSLEIVMVSGKTI